MYDHQTLLPLSRISFTERNLLTILIEYLREGSESLELCLCEVHLWTMHFTPWLRDPTILHLGCLPWPIT